MLHETLTNIAKKYPQDLVEQQIKDIPRISFNVDLALNTVKPRPVCELEICDLGGGIGLFSAGLAVLGAKRVVLIDDFNDPINHILGNSVLDIHKNLGIEVVSQDVVKDGISDIKGNFDIITIFDSMEHWHNSPKKLFHEIVKKLKPNGVLIISGPNCVNIRKRISVPFGVGKWSRMQEWYETEKFRGHVREPDINDLLYIAHDIGLTSIKIYGRNWLGYNAKSPTVRFATKIIDIPMRLIPSICSDIYLVGKKP